MIKINKGAEVPAVLLGRGAQERARLCAEFDKHSSEFISGTRKFEFESSIYNHKSVKELLIGKQHGKCFLCEACFRHVAHGDVEHFRPKGGYQQTTTDALALPGYYWLAYDWSNLLLSCQICNQAYKKNFFPLRDARTRARSHAANLSIEKPLLINPAEEDPQRYLSFRAEVPYAVRGSLRAKRTIELAGLNRPALAVNRRDFYRKMKVVYRMAHLNAAGDAAAEEARSLARLLLSEAVEDKAEYAGMMRAAIKSRFRLV